MSKCEHDWLMSPDGERKTAFAVCRKCLDGYMWENDEWVFKEKVRPQMLALIDSVMALSAAVVKMKHSPIATDGEEVLWRAAAAREAAQSLSEGNPNP